MTLLIRPPTAASRYLRRTAFLSEAAVPRRKPLFSLTASGTQPRGHRAAAILRRQSTSAGDSEQRAAYAFYQNKKKRPSSSSLSIGQRNWNTAWYAAAVVVGALGATYAAVPLYKVFCQTTGFGGTTQRVRILRSDEEDDSLIGSLTGFGRWVVQNVVDTVMPSSSSRPRVISGHGVSTWTDEDAAARLASLKPVENADLLTVRFDTTVGDVLPWSFVPVQLDVKVVPGETALSFFRVTNHSDKALTGVATYNVHPPKVGLYFQKIQCFCFEEQRLLPGETVDMPVFFFIDPEIVNDPQVSYIRSITLSYTFFQTDEDDGEEDD